MGRRSRDKRDRKPTLPFPAAGRERFASDAGGKRPVLRFVLLFAVYMAVFYAASLTPLAEQRAWPAYLEWNADASGALLRGLGQEVRVEDRMISSAHGGLLIERGCDAVHPSALFVAAVLASPVPWLLRLPGMLLGTLALMLTNLLRIVSLYFVQVFWPQAFEVMHLEVWQALFIFFAVLLWAAWAIWALRRSTAGADAGA